MRACLFNTYTEGGAAKSALRIHEAIRLKNPDTGFVSLYKGESNNPGVLDFRETQGWMKNMYLKGKNYIHQYRSVKLLNKYGEWYSEIDPVWNPESLIEKEKWDILHLNWISRFINIPHFVQKYNKKIIWTLHDHYPFSGGFHYPVELSDEKLIRRIQNTKNELRKLFDEFPVELVTPSKHLKELAESSGIFRSSTIHVIKYPVDHRVFRPLDKLQCRGKFGISGNAKVVFFLSDHIHYKRKGFEFLKQALLMFSDEIVLLVAGGGELPTRIGKVVVKHVGRVYDENLLCELYNAADVLVNPTLDDISSNTVIEAGACGIPSVVFSTGGVPELIRDGNGIVSKKHNAMELKIALENALEQAWDRDAIVESGKQEHGMDRIGNEYLQIYHGLSGK